MSEIVRIDPQTDALLITDATPTFMPGGGLAVPGGDEIVPGILAIAPNFQPNRIYATEDEHPHGHISLFSSYSGVEPYADLTSEMAADWGENRIASSDFDLAYLRWYLSNCIGRKQTAWPHHGLPHWRETRLHPEIARLDPVRRVKGTDPRCDSYSALRDNLGRRTGLGPELRGAGVYRLFLCGLAFNFCIGYSAKDAKHEGFETFVIEDLTRSVPIPGSAEAMRRELEDSDVSIISSDQLVRG